MACRCSTWLDYVLLAPDDRRKHRKLAARKRVLDDASKPEELMSPSATRLPLTIAWNARS